jgi:hypothetical protein
MFEVRLLLSAIAVLLEVANWVIPALAFTGGQHDRRKPRIVFLLFS